MSNKAYVGNLAYTATQQEITEFFSAYGEVQEVAIPTDRETGRPRGFAFVTFDSEQSAQAAVAQANGQDFSGRQLKVSIAQDRKDSDRGGRGGDRW